MASFLRLVQKIIIIKTHTGNKRFIHSFLHSFNLLHAALCMEYVVEGYTARVERLLKKKRKELLRMSQIDLPGGTLNIEHDYKYNTVCKP